MQKGSVYTHCTKPTIASSYCLYTSGMHTIRPEWTISGKREHVFSYIANNELFQIKPQPTWMITKSHDISPFLFTIDFEQCLNFTFKLPPKHKTLMSATQGKMILIYLYFCAIWVEYFTGCGQWYLPWQPQRSNLIRRRAPATSDDTLLGSDKTLASQMKTRLHATKEIKPQRYVDSFMEIKSLKVAYYWPATRIDKTYKIQEHIVHNNYGCGVCSTTVGSNPTCVICRFSQVPLYEKSLVTSFCLKLDIKQFQSGWNWTHNRCRLPS